MGNAIWVITEEPRKLAKFERDDPRLDWKWPHTPQGMVRLKLRGKDRYRYVHYGPTPEAAVLAFSKLDLDRIVKLKIQIEEIREQLPKLTIIDGKPRLT